MISKVEAKQRIIGHWNTWDGRIGKRSDKRAFFGWLRDEHPELLAFQTSGDKWLQVELWLYGK